MAYAKPKAAKSSAETTTRSEYKKADGFLNLKLVTADGTEFIISTGVPLHSEKKLDRSIINAVKADPSKVFTLTGTVHIVSEDDGEDFVL